LRFSVIPNQGVGFADPDVWDDKKRMADHKVKKAHMSACELKGRADDGDWPIGKVAEVHRPMIGMRSACGTLQGNLPMSTG